MKTKMAVFSSGFYAVLFFLCLEFSAVRVHAAETCKMLDVCSCQKSNGKVISLWEIDGGSAGPPPDFKDKPGSGTSSFLYSWNPCTPFAEKDGCKNAIICQTYAPASATFPIAREASSFTVIDNKTIALQYAAVEYDGDIRQGSIILKCDLSVEGTLSLFTQDRSLVYSATLTSRCACDDGCPRGNRDGGSSGSSGLSV